MTGPPHPALRLPTDSAIVRRFLALYLPCLATDRLRRMEPDLPADRPLATWAPSGNRQVLVAVDQVAATAGLRPGQALADAQTIAPHLLLRPADPEGDARALHALALWARCYTPLTAVDPPDGLLLDITGCDHLLGGEAALLRDALAQLQRAGITARGAVAGAAATSAALARARGDNPIAVSGIEAAVAAPLPLGPALRLPPTMLADLARLGLRRVCDLLDQPRGPLARRFGQELLDRLDAVTGQRRTAIRPVLPPPDVAVVQDLLEPIITRTGIDAVLDRLLDALCARLRQAGLGARRVVLLAWRVDGMVQEVAIGTGRPVREAAHLRRLFAERLERLEPGLGFERMALEARATEPMAAGTQVGLGIDGRRDAATAEALAQLLDRLAQRLRVQRIASIASHWPERSVAALGPHATPPVMPVGWAAAALPVLLLRRPAPLEAMVALLPDGPPSLLRWHGGTHRVHWAEGPQRLEPEWWRDRPGLLRRDYYRVELASGARLWICRTGPPEATRWLLHGHLP
ncbi:DNA polymerase Y family protein [Siccirubricoccus sp. G192]|uniref:Y-family DNA polymerase n=1 Tax=Siccirubricoccus sp. G192 TaxID=2849651 RepID=UPI001C2BBDBC|nr:DNA polymerase Y family protein [Siccirubricoccus sp. G192]MBV1800436.1 DNA polymerase Y family protein [Siccirubricoccus sp. G192]